MRVAYLYVVNKKYKVCLSKAQQEQLRNSIDKGEGSKTQRRRAQILLGCDSSSKGLQMKDAEIVNAYGVSLRTVEATRKRYATEGFELAWRGKVRPGRQPYKIDGEAESFLIATACSEAPEGYDRWTLSLLTSALKSKKKIASLSTEAVRQRLKKTSSSHGKTNTTS